MTSSRITAVYRVRSEPAAIESRAQAIALEQSVELPWDAIGDARVRDEVAGEVRAIAPIEQNLFEVTIGLAAETVGDDAGQLMNMLFGNSSLQRDVALIDVALDAALAGVFGGPRFGIRGLRERTGVRGRPWSCTALKPQGLAPDALAHLAGVFARSGIDVIKDDHGLADQAAAPFASRVPACQRAVAEANAAHATHARYAPSLTGSFDDMRRQLDVARGCGVEIALVAPMVSGVSHLQALVREAGMPLIAHPALAGAARIAPALLLGKLFRLFGADATIFPNVGGRFSYSRAECEAIATAARAPWLALEPALPVPAGGMTVERVPEMRAVYGNDVMLLIGGSLMRGGALDERCRAFARSVADVSADEAAQHA